MNAIRLGALVVALALIGWAVVYLRTEQTRATARMAAQQARWVELRSQWWSLQTRAARLRAPQQLRYRLETIPANIATQLLPPQVPGGPAAADERARLVRLGPDQGSD